MTNEQEKWLAENPKFSPVDGRIGVPSLKRWADEGYLYENGRFSPDDGKTLFWGPQKAIRVGRHYEMS